LSERYYVDRRLIQELIDLIRERGHDETARRLIHDVLTNQHAMDNKLTRILRKENILMALTAEETAAINQLSADIDTALAAATALIPQLQQSITDLTAQRDAIQAEDDADQAQVDALTASIADLQATLDSHATDVVTALTGLDDHVKAVTPA
jgi:hypothetical protein